MFVPSLLSHSLLIPLVLVAVIATPLWARPVLRGRVIVHGGAGCAGGVILCGSGAVWLLWLLSAVYLGGAPIGRER